MQQHGNRIERRRGLVPGWQQLQRLHGVNHHNLPIHHRHVNWHQLTDEHTLHVCHELPEYHCVDQPDHICHAHCNNLAVVIPINQRDDHGNIDSHQHAIDITKYEHDVQSVHDGNKHAEHHAFNQCHLHQINYPDDHRNHYGNVD